MFELGQLNVFTPKVRKGGGESLAIRHALLANTGIGGDEVCGDDLNLDGDVVGDHGDGGV